MKKKNTWDIILNMYTKTNDHVMHGSWNMVHNKQKDRQTNRHRNSDI